MLEALCEKITKHKHSRLEGHTIDSAKREYYYRCRICGFTYWNYTPPTDKELRGVDWYEDDKCG